MCVCVSPRFGTVPVPALGLFFHPVLALDKFVPDVARGLNGAPSAGTGCHVPELGA